MPKKLVSRYGIIKSHKINFDSKYSLFEIKNVIEKPKIEEAPSQLAIIGRYVLTPELFENINKICNKETDNGKHAPSSEIYITEAFLDYMKNGGKMYALLYEGIRFDCGSKIGLMKAHLYYSLRHPDMGKELRQYFKLITG